MEVDLEYSKELHELYNGYSSAPDKLSFKREILSDHQLIIADDNNTSIGNVAK